MRFLAILLTGLLGSVATADTSGIAWHEGDVESAFERARTEQKPLFLYWGAVWCPPCNQVKKTIFTRREFIEKSRLFVPVYLDGDSDRAQVWGEKLGVFGYPSMLVLDPGGQEIMRLPTGLQVEAFTRVLDEAMERLAPIATLLEEAVSDAKPVPDRTYRQLAYHSWDQTPDLELSTRELEDRLRRLADQVPDRLPVERSRLYLRWLQTADGLVNEAPKRGEKRFRMSRATRREADRRLREILASEELTRANLQFLTYATEMVRTLHPRDRRGRRSLSESWNAAMLRAENDESLSIRERLSVLMPAIDLTELEGEDPAADEALRERIRNRVAWADRTATDAYARQATMSTAGYLLRQVGLLDEARSLYLAEVERSESPYYFMSSLAAMARENGDNEEAIGWLAKAYAGSTGRATRFQWGTNYILGLVDLAPDDGERIRTESLRVLAELLESGDAFAGRNRSRVSSLAAKFRDWNADGKHEDTLSAVRDALVPACDALEREPGEGAEESLYSRCADFFETLGRDDS